MAGVLICSKIICVLQSAVVYLAIMPSVGGFLSHNAPFYFEEVVLD